MKRTIMTYGGYFERFMMTLNDKEQRKIDYIIGLMATEDRVPIKFIKHLRNGLYELRITSSGNTYRVFFIFDNNNIVVLFNGFNKKSQKTPINEIEKALRIRENYYADKRSQNQEL